MTATNTPDQLSEEQLLKQLSQLLGNDGDIEFIENPGNGGDALINAGAWQALDRVKAASRIVRPSSNSNGTPIYVYPGGGNLVPLYTDASTAIEQRLHKPFKRFVLLPHTVRGHEALLARLDERFHIFCRDLASWHHVRTHAPRVHVYLASDLALLLDVPKLLSLPVRLRCWLSLLTQPRALKRYLRWRRAIARIRPTAGSLRLMRVDVEARGGAAADPTMDLSAQYGALFTTRGEAELVTSDFLMVLQRADVIETDRLHVGIGASLLGKRVKLYDNSYGKNAAIHELSMRDRFPGTELIRH